MDGNYKIVKPLKFDDEEPTAVVLGFCGTDGSLLDVLSPLSEKWWNPIKTVLRPLLLDIRQAFGGSTSATWFPTCHMRKTCRLERVACSP